MFKDEIITVSNTAKTKLNLLNDNPLGYFVSSMLAGAYVGLAIVFIYTIGGLLNGSPFTRILMGASFGVGLSLVVMAGSELLTGNLFVMSLGMVKKTVNLKDSIKLWTVCLAGNWAGSILIAILFFLSGLNNGSVETFVANSAATKMSIAPVALIVRAILCNILVCLAVWTSYKLKSESGKLIMIAWCLFVFVTSGYEHSIANMTLLTLALFAPAGAAVSLAGYFYNISLVVLGNMIGAVIFLALPYAIIARDKPCVDCAPKTVSKSIEHRLDEGLIPFNAS